MSTLVISSQDQLSPRAAQAARNTIDGVAASGAIGAKVCGSVSLVVHGGVSVIVPT